MLRRDIVMTTLREKVSVFGVILVRMRENTDQNDSKYKNLPDIHFMVICQPRFAWMPICMDLFLSHFSQMFYFYTPVFG